MSDAMGSDAMAERLAMRPESVPLMLLDQVRASGSREAFRYLQNGQWVSLSWEQTKDRAFVLAAGLLSLGVGPEDRVAIASSTRIEWILADLGIMCAGGATTTVYPTTQHEDVSFILSDSGSKVIFAEDADQVAKVVAHLDGLPDVRAIVVFSGTIDHELVLTLDQLEDRGREHLAANPDSVQQAIAAIRKDDLDLDLHLRHDGASQGCRADPRRLDL
jgi:long-chain acyl-CoA synthetase